MLSHTGANGIAHSLARQVMCLFPRSAALLRKKVIHLALRRHLISAKRRIRERGLERARSSRHASLNEALFGKGGEEHTSFIERLSSQSSPQSRQSTTENEASGADPLDGAASAEASSGSQWRSGRLRGLNRGLSKRQLKNCRSVAQLTAVRTNAVDLALLLQDKQISQSEWRVGGAHGGGEQAAAMAHSEVGALAHAGMHARLWASLCTASRGALALSASVWFLSHRPLSVL